MSVRHVIEIIVDWIVLFGFESHPTKKKFKIHFYFIIFNFYHN